MTTIERFFNGNTEFAKEVDLTQEEIDLFERFEWAILCHNGLRQINGGWSAIEIQEIDIDDDTDAELLKCKASCGVQDEDGKEFNEWGIVFNRVTKKFKGENDEE